MPVPFAGRYELHEQLGAGGTGSVWRAWDRKQELWVAVKVLTQSEAGTLLRFVREQSLRVQHPHVVAPSGWAADDEHIALSMDLVRGGSLETLLGDHGPLPEAYVAVLLDQILDGLAAIHGAGVVHRDVKPANILLEPTGSSRPFARVSDFGVATRVGEPRLTARGHTVGTRGYVAPEAGVTDPAPTLDLYAVGILGKRLLTAADPDQLPTENPSQIWAFLHQLSNPDPSLRPQSAEAARRVLAPYVSAGEPWAGDDAPYVFEQLTAPAPNFVPTEALSAATSSQLTARLPTAAATSPRLTRQQLRAAMAASLVLAAILLAIVLILLVK